MTGVQTCALPICFPVTIWGGVNWVSGNTYKSKVQSLNNLVIRAYHNHDDEELWDKLIGLARRERERITHGVWVYIRGVPTFLPPNYYFTLTYVPNKEGKDIEYIDSDRLSYLFSWWHIITGKRGVFYLKRRQSGKSIELGANLLWLLCLVGDENFALQSMNDEKLKILYSTCFQRPFESLPLILIMCSLITLVAQQQLVRFEVYHLEQTLRPLHSLKLISAHSHQVTHQRF